MGIICLNNAKENKKNTQRKVNIVEKNFYQSYKTGLCSLGQWQMYKKYLCIYTSNALLYQWYISS